MTERTHDHRNSDESREGAADAGASLPGDRAGGAGKEWRGKLEDLREGRRERRRWRSLKQPLIGLTMAGAAAPMVHAMKPDAAAPPQPPRQRAAASEAAMSGDVEDAVGQRWANAAADRARENTIAGAMVEFDIDRDLAEAIYDIASEEGIEAEIAFGLVRTESTFRERAVSHVGARGLTQVLPSTARWMMPEIRTASQLFEPETNLRVGFRYLRYLLDKYDSDVRLALLAYNRGPGTVDRILSRGGNPDNGYAQKVLRG